MIELEVLNKERDELKKRLADIELQNKELELKVRTLRQQEIQTKREIEALSVLIDLQQDHPEG